MSKLLSKLLGRGQEKDEAVSAVTVAAGEESPEQAANQPKAAQDWLEEDEGQLSVDVYQTPDQVIIKSTIAGVQPDDVDIAINNDMITIRGERRQEDEVKEDDYFYQECYWGAFSRSIILPVEVKAEEVEATLRNGVLTIRLPKAKKSKSIAVKIRTE